jgi:hypothetical protein
MTISHRKLAATVAVMSMLAAPHAAAGPAETLAKDLEVSFKKRLPIKTEGGGTLYDVQAIGSSVTMKYKFAMPGGPAEEMRRAFIEGMCSMQGGFATLTELGGKVMTVLEFNDKTVTAYATRENCKPKVVPLTRADLQQLLSQMTFPTRNPNGTVVSSGRLGEGLEVILTVDEDVTPEAARKIKADPAASQRAHEQQKKICEVVALRRYIKGGATLTYRHEAHGVPFMDVQVNQKLCQL